MSGEQELEKCTCAVELALNLGHENFCLRYLLMQRMKDVGQNYIQSTAWNQAQGASQLIQTVKNHTLHLVSNSLFNSPSIWKNSSVFMTFTLLEIANQLFCRIYFNLVFFFLLDYSYASWARKLEKWCCVLSVSCQVTVPNDLPHCWWCSLWSPD